MHARPDEGATAALFRMIAARTPGVEIAVYAIGPRRIRLVATTSAGARLAAEQVAAGWGALAQHYGPILAAGVCARVDPWAFGLKAGFGALAPLLAPGGAPIGLLLVGDARRRRLGPGFAATLADAAPIAAALLAAAERTAMVGRVGGDAFAAAHAPPSAPPTQAGAALHPATRDHRSVAAAATAGRFARELAAAAGRDQLRLVFQGYLDLANGRVSGAEALLRWRHPVRGELAPAAFIPLAEANGLILPLGAWALRTALAAAARWPGRLALSVNVSALQFRQPGFAAEIEAALASAGVAPDRLELEITETVLMHDDSETIGQLEALIARGVRIAIDDFGTGYSALAYLGRLPHHRIKLDRAFMEDMDNPATLELVRAITALARRTGVAVTAEGVERPDQLRLVRGLGFTHAQGFITGPLVADPAALLDVALTAL